MILSNASCRPQPARIAPDPASAITAASTRNRGRRGAGRQGVRGAIGDEGLAWLKSDLATQQPQSRIVVLTHRPLFPLYPQWDWATRDGDQAIAALMPYQNVTVFYGHIHQEHHHKTGNIEHHAAKGLMFALPAPGSQLKRTPVAWDPAAPYKGLGFREVEAEAQPVKYGITELPVVNV